MPPNELSGPFRARVYGSGPDALVDIGVKLVFSGEQIVATPASQADAECPRGAKIPAFLVGRVDTAHGFTISGRLTLCTPAGSVFDAAINEDKTAGAWQANFKGTVVGKCLIDGMADGEKWTAGEKKGHVSDAKLHHVLTYQHQVLLHRESPDCPDVPPANAKPSPAAGEAKAATQKARRSWHAFWDDFWEGLWQGGGQKR
jgi:hypothetical protein